jgi:rhomboid protease GluP
MDEEREDLLLLASFPAARAAEVELLLLAMGIAPTVRHGVGQSAIWVADGDLERARALVAEDSREAATRTAPAPPPRWEPAPHARRGVLVLLAAILVWFAFTHFHSPPTDREDWLRHGAISWTQIERGEIWRFVSALFLHFDTAHLLSNTLVFLLVAPPLADVIGPVRLVAVFLASGVAGNLASHALSPSLALKAGASGSIAGLLGALAGHQLRPDRRSRYRRWQVLGALAAVYALLVGTGPGRDDVAHLGGLLCGLALGRILAPGHTPDPPATR